MGHEIKEMHELLTRPSVQHIIKILANAPEPMTLKALQSVGSKDSLGFPNSLRALCRAGYVGFHETKPKPRTYWLIDPSIVKKLPDIRTNDLKILEYLKFEPCSTKKGIQAALGIKPATVSDELFKLTKKGLIERKKKANSREYIYSLPGDDLDPKLLPCRGHLPWLSHLAKENDCRVTPVGYICQECYAIVMKRRSLRAEIARKKSA